MGHVQVLTKFEIQFERVKGFASDSAAYMNACVPALQGIINEFSVHVQCWSHKLDKLERIPPTILKRLNEFIMKTKEVYKNTRKRRHKYAEFLEKKYEVSKEKKVLLFPVPVMNRWNSWKLASDYVDEYCDDLVEYIKTLTEEVSAITYFKSLTKEDVAIIKAEAAFVKEHCSAPSEFLCLLGNNEQPLAHRLYPKLEEFLTAYTIIEKHKNIGDVLGKRTAAATTTLSQEKKRNVEDRFRYVARSCRTRLQGLMDSDRGKSFFRNVATLLHPVKMMSSSEEAITKALKELTMLSGIPLAELQVLHAVLKENVRCKLTSPGVSSDHEKLNTAVQDVVVGMLAVGGTSSAFASQCLKLMYFSVSNLDCERAFSSYGDVVTPKRSRMKVSNADIVMSLYVGNRPSDLNENVFSASDMDVDIASTSDEDS